MQNLAFSNPPQNGESAETYLGRLAVATLGASPTTMSTALEASRIIKAAPGNLLSLTVYNSNPSNQFILLLNATTLTANGAVPLIYPSIPIAANSILVLNLPHPIIASIGIVVCNSSTGGFTKTIGSADCVFHAQYN